MAIILLKVEALSTKNWTVTQAKPVRPGHTCLLASLSNRLLSKISFTSRLIL